MAPYDPKIIEFNAQIFEALEKMEANERTLKMVKALLQKAYKGNDIEEKIHAINQYNHSFADSIIKH